MLVSRILSRPALQLSFGVRVATQMSAIVHAIVNAGLNKVSETCSMLFSATSQVPLRESARVRLGTCCCRIRLPGVAYHYKRTGIPTSRTAPKRWIEAATAPIGWGPLTSAFRLGSTIYERDVFRYLELHQAHRHQGARDQ
jgi:hypothetical protein